MTFAICRGKKEKGVFCAEMKMEIKSKLIAINTRTNTSTNATGVTQTGVLSGRGSGMSKTRQFAGFAGIRLSPAVQPVKSLETTVH